MSEEQQLSTESAQAIAEKVLGETIVPKKVPAVDDIDAQIAAIGAVLSDALLTATETPIGALAPVAADLAAQLVALGVRQTEHCDPAALHAPAWVVDGMRAQSVKLPDPPVHTDTEPYVARTSNAPEYYPPSVSRAVRR